jgi:hypothetical protein
MMHVQVHTHVLLAKAVLGCTPSSSSALTDGSKLIWCFLFLQVYIKRCLSSIEKGEAVLPCLSLLTKIFMQDDVNIALQVTASLHY